MTAMSNHERTLAFVGEFVSEQGYGPSVREVAAALGCSISTAAWHLGSLKREGKLVWVPGKQRTLRVVA
jgi:SOS-response transcriptional repressor LexA